MKVSRCTSVVSGKSLACFFWKGSASFFKSIADYSLGRVIGLIFVVHANGRSVMDRLDWLMAVMSWLYWVSQRNMTVVAILPIE